MSEWIDVKDIKPDYYKQVIIFTNRGKILYEWHRLNDGEYDFYANLNNGDLLGINEVTHWMPTIKPPIK